MAREFTGGSGDKIEATTQAAANALTQYSVSVWVRRDSASGYPAALRKLATDAFYWTMENDNSSVGWGVVFATGWTTQNGYWSIDYPDTAWHQYVFTYDHGATTNDPIIYKDGVSQTITERLTPSGSRKTDRDVMQIGNNSDAFGWDGGIAEVAIWNRILTAADANALGKGFSPAFFPNGLVYYAPLTGRLNSEVDLRGSKSGVITGTVNASAHPKIIYPQGLYVGNTTPAVGGGSFPVWKNLMGVGL